MTNPTTNDELLALIARMREPIDFYADAHAEATRIILKLYLCQPISLPLAMKIVATELGHGATAAIEATARELHKALTERRDMPEKQQ